MHSTDLITIKFVRNTDGATFVLGGSTKWKFLKNGLDGFGSFDNDINYIDNGTHDGGIVTSTRISSKDRTVKCGYVNPKDNEAVRKRVTAFFKAKATYKCYVSYMGKTLWAECYLYKFSLSMSPKYNRMDMVLMLTFPIPYLKSYDDFGADIAGKTPLIGFPYMVASAGKNPKGLTGGVFNFASKIEIVNDGDVETYCKAVFKATDTVINPSLVIGDNFVKVLDRMEQGDVIEMDFTSLPPTVKKNGVNYIGHCDRSSSFTNMIIDVGTSEISYTADDGSGSLSVSLYYNKLYTSI